MSESETQESEEPTEPNVEQSDPAKRLHAIIEVALGQNPGITALDAWASTLGIDISAAQADPHDVIDRLRLMKEEIGRPTLVLPSDRRRKRSYPR